MAKPGISGTPYGNLIQTSLHGRRIGLQRLTSGQSGGNHGELDLLIGPIFRQHATTANTTGTNLLPTGVQYANSTSAGSSAVYTIDPPIPGVGVTIVGTTQGPAYVKTANAETIVTTAGSSYTTVKITSLGGSFQLVGLTTALWAGLGLTTGTSSQGSGFVLSTST